MLTCPAMMDRWFALAVLLATSCGDPEPTGGIDAPAAADGAIDGVAVDAPIDAPPNLPPQVGPIAGPATLVAGASGTFAVAATDAEGDPLTYAWSATGAVAVPGEALSKVKMNPPAPSP